MEVMGEQAHCLGDRLYSAILRSLEQHIAVMDGTGRIVYVNEAWANFGRQNGAKDVDWLARNYLEACRKAGESGDANAAQADRGIRDILEGKAGVFTHEYPCHAAGENRWFLMTFKPLEQFDPGHFVASHLNITQRKVAELLVESLAIRDPLTGLSNRRHFEQVYASEWSRSRREGTPMSLVILDIDRFKELNDRLGHAAGDHYLRNVAAIVQKSARRPGDLAVRWGGDEFVLLLANTGSAAAAAAAEEIRAAVQDLAREAGLDCTVSAGTAGIVPQAKVDNTLFETADSAMYQAKRAGGNRVVLVPVVGDEAAYGSWSPIA